MDTKLGYSALFSAISAGIFIIPLSFNTQPYFTFATEMLTLDPAGYSIRWYRSLLENPQWINAIKNSFIIGIASTILATTLGTVAALGLSRSSMPFKGAVMAMLISPMIVPVIITAAGMYFFFSSIGLAQTYLGLILAHTVLGTPFVVITVTATMSGFDLSLIRASASMGATPIRTFFSIIAPLIAPGVFSGGLFAFITSFDEVVVVLFLSSAEQRTVPRQMWAGIREQISPTILAVATMLIVVSVMLLLTLEYLRRLNDKLRGVQV